MSHQPTKNPIIEAIETATQAEPGNIAESTKLLGLSGWDSLGIVNFIELILENCGVELSVDDVLECVTVQELVDKVLYR